MSGVTGGDGKRTTDRIEAPTQSRKRSVNSYSPTLRHRVRPRPESACRDRVSRQRRRLRSSFTVAHAVCGFGIDIGPMVCSSVRMAHNETTYGMRVHLTRKQRALLYRTQRDVQVDSLTARRARILELLGDGLPQCEVASATGAGIATVGRTRRRFIQEGLDVALWGYKAPGASPLLDEKQKTRIIALACTEAPEGRTRWTTSLLAEYAVRKGIVTSVGRETVRITLHERGIKPWREKKVVRAGPR